MHRDGTRHRSSWYTLKNRTKWYARAAWHRVMMLNFWFDRRFGRSPLKQIVVCGYPRGGTSLLYNMLSSSLRGFVFDEFEVSARDSIEKYENHASKDPMDVLRVAELVEHNVYEKEIHVIVLIRDVRDLVTSIHPNVPDRYFMGYTERWSPQGEYPYTLVQTTRGVRACFEAIEQLRSTPDVNLNIVKYESLVSDPDNVQGELATALDVGFEHPFSQFHMRPEKHAYRYEGKTRAKDPGRVRENSAADRSRVQRWRRPEHAGRIRTEFAAHPELFAILRHYGYETDDGWFAAYRTEGRTPAAVGERV